MTAKEVFEIHYKLTPSSKGWYRFKDSAHAVNFEQQRVKDHKSGNNVFLRSWMYCNIKNFAEYNITFDYIQYFSPAEKVKVDERLVLPSGYRSILDDDVYANTARTYLKSRGIDPIYADSQMIGICDEGDFKGRLIIPVFIDGVLSFYTGRSFMDSPLRFLNPVGYSKSHYILGLDEAMKYDTIYVVEGAFCKLTMGDDCICIFGNSMSQRQISTLIHHLSGKGKTLVFGHDRGYYHKFKQSASKLMHLIDVKVPHIHYEVLHDRFGTDECPDDINDIGRERFVDISKGFELLSFKNLHSV